MMNASSRNQELSTKHNEPHTTNHFLPLALLAKVFPLSRAVTVRRERLSQVTRKRMPSEMEVCSQRLG